MDAIFHWKVFDADSPYDPDLNDLSGARKRVAALIDIHASPNDMIRCGADAGRLAALGYTLDDLIRKNGYIMEDFIDGFNLNWNDFMALGFHPSLLRYRAHFPIVTMVQRFGLNSSQLLSQFALGYDQIIELGITQEELCFMGFDAATLMQIGMRGEHIAYALLENGVNERGVGWWMKAFNFTSELYETISLADFSALDQDAKGAYASLSLLVARVK